MVRRYSQTCPVARAAEIVGERWTLLIVRELLLGPKRFSALQQRLTGMSPSVLTQRLEGLEQHGVVQRREHPAPVSAAVYELTESGKDLLPVIHALGRWGLRYFFPPRADDHFEPDWMRAALATFARRDPSPPLHFSVLVRIGDERYGFDVRGSQRGTQVEERDSSAEERLEVDAQLLPMLMAGFLDVDSARESGSLVLEGDPASLRDFPALFEMDFGDVDPQQIKAAMG